MYPEKTEEAAGMRQAWRVVFLLCIVGLLNYLDRSMITTMRVSILKDMPMTEAQFGLLTSVFLWIYGILSPLAGFLADRFNRSRVIIISLLVWSTVTCMTGFAKTFEELLITRSLMGISEACYIPAALALIVDYHKGKTRSLAVGIHMSGMMAGQALGFIGGWIAEKQHWSLSFLLLGAVGIIYSVLLMVFLKDAPGFEKHPKQNQVSRKIHFFRAVHDLFSQRSYVMLLLYWGMLGVVSWMVMGWLPTFYHEHFKLSQTDAGIYATGYLYPAALAGALIGGYWADRWSIINKRARILVPLIGICIAAPFIFIASVSNLLPLTICFFMVYALSRAFCDSNMMPILCMVVDQRYRATAYGILNLFACMIGGLGLFAGGYLRDLQIRLSTIYQMAALSLMICAVLLLMVKPVQVNK